ncbi:unnamed protein product [[Actinomadura] parvosata subsp. kistnae]|uniref:ESX-1 secretion-associated protein n=1 Tax=Nonomuraea composti TaxID=2720023 RepID=A0ABX1BDY6_9ACTN|nr:hypothetical protein [Nonomuraea sp. FMUSA5-5]NJP95965.1 hypothetical protein [Nonomuraea sp. FMUSA5-5]SPL88358.1 unnamed protein product [Actinomadura parvosata subsp. kistnae]
MAQEIYVTSAAISSIQHHLDETFIPALEALKKTIDDTDVPAPGFGMPLGLALSQAYGARQDDVRGAVDKAVKTVEAWVTALETIKKNWRDAEESSTVVYK